MTKITKKREDGAAPAAPSLAITKRETLYDITAEYAAIRDALLDDPDLDLAARFEALADRLEQKVERIVGLIRSLEAEEEEAAVIAKRIAAWKKARTLSGERLREFLRSGLLMAQVKQVKGPGFTISITEPTAKSARLIIDPALLPDRFKREEVICRDIVDEGAVRLALERGEEIPGARLEPGEPRLQLR